MAFKIQTGTKHSDNCTRAFKNYDPKCPRCQELSAGGKPRAGWNIPAPVIPITQQFCFCPDRNIYNMDRCPTCNRHVYTD